MAAQAKDYAGSAELLTRRQARLYEHTCDLYDAGAGRSINAATGEPTEGTEPGLIAKNVPCWFVFTSNIDDVTPVGRIKRDILDTTDRIHFHSSVPVRAGYWSVFTTKGHPNYGAVHKILGAPQHASGSARRSAETQIVLATQSDNVPTSLKVRSR